MLVPPSIKPYNEPESQTVGDHGVGVLSQRDFIYRHNIAHRAIALPNIMKGVWLILPDDYHPCGAVRMHRSPAGVYDVVAVSLPRID
ncbi:uncharacterized protein TRAVEDRAFT_51833 [Trametes versicolor FP-101664 SS1]|uniref:uncharacterized protein n=1 Tax=Trametes versicolor (strain FP-101664) TaxID=717944 RepID=UPI00046221E7|nr:uncharacterized protein TRAVEDRAFT_51833 [Trametes versicolor FP-101664 SS1]EIW54108.1 hypothetical protein TRAVEDRAFT_51833 [Trametes versicolor FP-101664 SS1]